MRLLSNLSICFRLSSFGQPDFNLLGAFVRIHLIGLSAFSSVIRLSWNALKVRERFGFSSSSFFCEESGEIRTCKRSTWKYLQGLVNAKNLIELLVNLQSDLFFDVS